MGSGISSNDISDITVNNNSITDKTQMAEEFNRFFSHIGKHISNSIPPSPIDPLTYINTPADVPNLEFHRCHPGQIIDLVKNFDNKSSPDLDGISITLIKRVILEIVSPLAHIFHSVSTLGSSRFIQNCKSSSHFQIW